MWLWAWHRGHRLLISAACGQSLEIWEQAPDRYRGKLVELRVHLRLAIIIDNVAANDLGVTSLHEVFGWNSGSQQLVLDGVDELPSMPGQHTRGSTFVGYFLKLLPYEDREAHPRAAVDWPLDRHPAPRRVVVARQWTWTWYGGGLIALFALRWGWCSGPARPARHSEPSAQSRRRAVNPGSPAKAPPAEGPPAMPIKTRQ